MCWYYHSMRFCASAGFVFSKRFPSVSSNPTIINLPMLTRLIPMSMALLGIPTLLAATGPFDPEAWPATLNASKTVHYVAFDSELTPPGDNWLADELTVLNDGDQTTADYAIGGHTGKKATSNFLGVGDHSYSFWADHDTIDILVQVYGDGALFNAQGNPRDFSFLTGTLPELAWPVGGSIAVEARNKKWNWHLFRIANGFRPAPHADLRFVGNIPDGAQGNVALGGVNGGTIRFEGVPNLIVRVVAFGEQGAFGEPEDINKYASGDTCDPEPNTNLASVDFNAGTTNHVQMIDDGDQTVTYVSDAGPAGDQRKAVVPNGTFLNFGITDHYLGVACNDPRTVKVCVDFYDDPAFAGADVHFGPEAYATDAQSGIGFYAAANRQLLQGTGKWIRRSWTIPAVGLRGVNAGALTAGPRFVSENGQVAVSRFALGIFRVGTHPLAGQDPLPDCFEDPNICTDAYGSYAELDLAKDVKNGLDVGTSSGDQNMVLAEAGPASDRRQAVRPARDDVPGNDHFLNFAILNEALGPSSQPNAHLVIVATYYDDPALVGKRFKPEVFQVDTGGQVGFGFTDDSAFVTITGTDKWRDAYWEIPALKFIGVNQGPQAAARFTLDDKIFFTRLQYAVIRPCGPNAGKNPLEAYKPATEVNLAVTRTGNQVVLTWPASATGFTLQETASLNPPAWTASTAEVVTEQDSMKVTVTVGAENRFFRLMK